MLVLYLFGVVSAAAVAVCSAAVVGLERSRQRGRPLLSLVPPSEDATGETALDRALHSELRRRARGGRPRRKTG